LISYSPLQLVDYYTICGGGLGGAAPEKEAPAGEAATGGKEPPPARRSLSQQKSDPEVTQHLVPSRAVGGTSWGRPRTLQMSYTRAAKRSRLDFKASVGKARVEKCLLTS